MWATNGLLFMATSCHWHNATWLLLTTPIFYIMASSGHATFHLITSVSVLAHHPSSLVLHLNNSRDLVISMTTTNRLLYMRSEQIHSHIANYPSIGTGIFEQIYCVAACATVWTNNDYDRRSHKTAKSAAWFYLIVTKYRLTWSMTSTVAFVNYDARDEHYVERNRWHIHSHSMYLASHDSTLRGPC